MFEEAQHVALVMSSQRPVGHSLIGVGVHLISGRQLNFLVEELKLMDTFSGRNEGEFYLIGNTSPSDFLYSPENFVKCNSIQSTNQTRRRRGIGSNKQSCWDRQ